MSLDVLRAVRDKVFGPMSPEAAPSIVWHAGEPTAVPLRWYEEAQAILAPSVPSRSSFAVQTNGVGLSPGFARFFVETGTRVGLSIDGPQRFHDARRRTRAGGPTWDLAMRGLSTLREAGGEPGIVTVLHPEGLAFVEEYYRFYRDNDLTKVSFSIDEAEGANTVSSFARTDKSRITSFFLRLMELAYSDAFPLSIREIERIAGVLTGAPHAPNEQVDPWSVVVIAASGNVTSFSPEFMEIKSAAHNDFCFGNILVDDLGRMGRSAVFRRTAREIEAGVARCRAECRYFDLCGGGAPTNKITENGSLASAETAFCRLSIQSAADALFALLARRREPETLCPQNHMAAVT